MDKDFAFLEGWDAADVAALLADELPATVATALKALPREMNTKVFLKLPPEIRNDVAAAMATAKVPGSLLDVMRGDIAAGLRDKAASFRREGQGGAASSSPASSSASSSMAGGRPAPGGLYAPSRPRPAAPAPNPASAPAAAPGNPLSAMLANLSPQLRHTLESAAGYGQAGRAGRTGQTGQTGQMGRAGPAGGASVDPLRGEDFAAEGLRPVNAAPETPPEPSRPSGADPLLGADFAAEGLRPVNAAPGPAPRAAAVPDVSPTPPDPAATLADGLRRRSAMEQITLARQQLRGGAASAASAGGRLEMERFRRKAMDEELARARQLAHRGGPQKIDGMALAASIVRQAGAAVSDNLHQAMPQLYRQLRQRMFVFDDLVNSPDRTLTILFSVLRPEVAAIALRFGPDRLMERVMALLPARQAGRIQDAIAGASAQVRVSDIEKAHQGIIDLAVQLQAKGKLVIDPNDPDLV